MAAGDVAAPSRRVQHRPRGNRSQRDPTGEGDSPVVQESAVHLSRGRRLSLQRPDHALPRRAGGHCPDGGQEGRPARGVHPLRNEVHLCRGPDARVARVDGRVGTGHHVAAEARSAAAGADLSLRRRYPLAQGDRIPGPLPRRLRARADQGVHREPAWSSGIAIRHSARRLHRSRAGQDSAAIRHQADGGAGGGRPPA